LGCAYYTVEPSNLQASFFRVSLPGFTFTAHPCCINGTYILTPCLTWQATSFLGVTFG
jgi:hypothetical protein